ncbi:MAG: radical SAM protein [Methanomassiliicoccales archaeon]|nr:radical SAM protein [Methanomassiliicoccales archaeon]
MSARTVYLYRPGKDFPALSVTGEECQLQCDHCRGRYLRGMVPVRSPQELLRKASELNAAGATGLLLSGGCDRRGRVPLLPFLPAVREVKEITPLSVNLHPGLVSQKEAEKIASTGVDRISFDLVLDPRVLRERMHLSVGPEENVHSFQRLCRSAPGRVVPHVLLGLGDERQELGAVRMAREEGAPCVILLSLLGEHVPDWQDRLLRAVRAAAELNITSLLGCMRPRSFPGLEMAALEAGAAGVACPAPGLLEELKGKGWKVERHSECCALHR